MELDQGTRPFSVRLEVFAGEGPGTEDKVHEGTDGGEGRQRDGLVEPLRDMIGMDVKSITLRGKWNDGQGGGYRVLPSSYVVA